MGNINFHDVADVTLGGIDSTRPSVGRVMHYRDLDIVADGKPLRITLWNADPTRLMTSEERAAAAEAELADDPSTHVEIGGEG
jgi:hypothetical protein